MSTIIVLLVFAFALAYGIFESIKGFIPILAVIIVFAEAAYGAYTLYYQIKRKHSGGQIAITFLSTAYCMFISYIMWFLGGADKSEGPLDFIATILGFIVLMGPFCFMIAYWLECLGDRYGSLAWSFIKCLLSGGIILFLFFV
jgi:hypothetical protein